MTCALVAGCRIHFDALGGDAQGATDGRINDVLPPNTVTFGERPTSTYQNVTADTWVDDTIGTHNFGRDVELSLAAAPSNGEHILIRFDLSALAPGTPIVGARLLLGHIVSGDEIAGNLTIARITEAWEEGNGLDSVDFASWFDRMPSTPWTTDGGTTGAVIAPSRRPRSRLTSHSPRRPSRPGSTIRRRTSG